MKKFLISMIAIITLSISTVYAGYVQTNRTILTRGIALKMIYEFAGSPATTVNSPFVDKSGNYESAIDWAYENEILLGFGDGTCRPNENITREQFATLLGKYSKMQMVNANLIRYKDRNEVSDWAKDAMHFCIGSGIIKGREIDEICPKGLIMQNEATIMLDRLKNLPDITFLKKDIEELTKKPRNIGADAEKSAVSYLSERFEKMGYKVTFQEYSDGENIIGNNVIATRTVPTSSIMNPDILVISAHHDSVATSFGANDNASGVAALLQVAELLKDVEIDTELRFISFTDEENGKNGSRKYVDSLSETERERIIGCIQFDMLGGLGSLGNKVCTTDGASNWITELFEKQDSDLTFGNEENSDHAIFQIAGIPSVVVTQDGRGYLYHSAGDTEEMLNLWKIHNAATSTANVVKYIASESTPSYQETVKLEKDKHFYSHTRQSKILYSASREMNEAYLGFSGQLIKEWDETFDIWSDKYEVYMYKMGWFGGDKTMETHYIYRNGYLENVEIHPNVNDYTMEELCTLITNTHGMPLEKDDESYDGVDWQDEIYGKYISLKEVDGKPIVYMYSYSVGLSNTIANYECVSGDTIIANQAHKEVWDLLCSFLPIELRQNIGEFRLFTDGYSNILAYTSTMGTAEKADNTKFIVAIDYYDVYDENGNARDWSKLINTIVHEYGHVILENDSQIDVSIDSDIHKPETFIEGSFRKKYYDEFWQDPYSSFLGTYLEKPENYVSEYAGNMFHEDLADTFAVFVFFAKPTGDSIAEKKILFFWNDSEMVNLREDIRNGLGLN